MIFKSTAFIPRLIASSYKGLGTVEKIFRVGSLILILALFFIFIFTGMVRLGVFGSLPSIAEIKSIKNPVSSVLLDDNGKSFGKYFIENRTNVNYNSISPHIIQALIEDFPEFMAAYDFVAEVREEMGKLREAQEALQSATMISPNNTARRRFRWWWLWRWRRRRELVKWFCQKRKYEHSAYTNLFWAFRCARNGRFRSGTNSGGGGD